MKVIMRKPKRNFTETKNILEEINTNSEMYYISLLLLSSLKKKCYSNIPELSLILDEENLLRLINVYGGQTITIPTKEEVKKYLQIVMVYYYSEIKGLQIKEAMKKAGASDNAAILKNVYKLRNLLEESKIPNFNKILS